MRFKEINARESLSPMNGKTFTDIVNVRGKHTNAYCLIKGFSVRRWEDDMQMRQFKFYSKAIRDEQNSTASNTRFIVTTKIVHFGVEDDFWWDNPDTLFISYNVLMIIP